MLIVLKIGDVVASLYATGWDISSGKTVRTGADREKLIKRLNEIMGDDNVLGYTPNIYYSKGKEIEKAIPEAKMLDYYSPKESTQETKDRVY